MTECIILHPLSKDQDPDGMYEAHPLERIEGHIASLIQDKLDPESFHNIHCGPTTPEQMKLLRETYLACLHKDAERVFLLVLEYIKLDYYGFPDNIWSYFPDVVFAQQIPNQLTN